MKQMYSLAEENYLKAIYHISNGGKSGVSTNALADALNTKPASVSDMIKKLAQKEAIEYEPYRGVKLSKEGLSVALKIIRKHRLWEVFLVEKLNFNWDEVHDVAEQLEHIKSSLLVERLDKFLGFPQYDPHGDPIPNAKGEILLKPKIKLSEFEVGKQGLITAVNDSSSMFLQYLDKIGAYIGATIELLDRVEFDGSIQIRLDKQKTLFISREAAENIMIMEEKEI